jgi:hypothetical protein
VQHNLLSPPFGWASGSQDSSSRRANTPLYHGFKEVEENWSKHFSSGQKEDCQQEGDDVLVFVGGGLVTLAGTLAPWVV